MAYDKMFYSGFYVYKLALLALGSFIFSWIFWGTKKWLDKKPGKKGK